MRSFSPGAVTAIIVAVALHSLPLSAQRLLSLRSAVDSAKRNNPGIRAESYNIELASGSVMTARLHTNPILNNQTLLLTDSKYYPAGTELSNPVNRQVWWQLTKPFVPVQQRRNRIDLAVQNVEISKGSFSESIRNFSLTVAQQWLTVYAIQARLELLDEAYQNIDSLVKINQTRLKNQVITQTDLIRTRLLQEQYRLQIVSLQKEFRTEQQQLKFLLATPDSIGVDTESAVELIPIPANPDSVMALAFQARPDLAIAQHAIQAAEINQKYQKSLVLPQPELGVIWNPQNTIPYVGFFGTIRIPLFDRNQGEIEKSKYYFLQATEGLRNTRFRLTTEVRAALQAYETDRANLSKYEDMMNQADQVLESVRYAYLKGGTNIIDFLDAQRSWFDTRQFVVNARNSYYQSYIQVLYVTGLINQL